MKICSLKVQRLCNLFNIKCIRNAAVAIKRIGGISCQWHLNIL